MPYIEKVNRRLVDQGGPRKRGLDALIEHLDYLRDTWPNTKSVGWHPGTLNYIITRLCDYWCKPEAYAGEANYEKYNTVIGVLECVKQELYRRQIAPYEDKKCEENGDVYYE